jgi:hypothetical protein
MVRTPASVSALPACLEVVPGWWPLQTGPTHGGSSAFLVRQRGVSHLWRHRSREARVPLYREARHARGGRDDLADGRERATRQRLSRHIVRYRSLAARPRAWFGGCFATSLASSRHSARPSWGVFKVLFAGVAHPVRSHRPISSRRNVGVTRDIGVSALEWNLDHVYHSALYPKLYQNSRPTRLTKNDDDPGNVGEVCWWRHAVTRSSARRRPRDAPTHGATLDPERRALLGAKAVSSGAAVYSFISSPRSTPEGVSRSA